MIRLLTLRIALAALALALAWGVARADQAALPYPVQGMVRQSGSTLAADKVALAANKGRKVFCVQNPSTATESLFLDFGEAASTTAGTSIEILPGLSQCMGGTLIYLGDIHLNAVTSPHAYIAFEGQ